MRTAGNAQPLNERLRRASQSYHETGSCTQAVLNAFAANAASLPAQQPSDLCGVLRAADCILHDSGEASNRELGQIMECFRLEYGGVTCEEILQSVDPSSQCCCMKVKDAVLLIQRALEQTTEMEGEAL